MDKRKQWILAGYKLIAEQGMHALNAEYLASIVGSSKSSFYHYFGTLDEFKTMLFEHHVNQADIVSKQIDACENFIPDVVYVFLDNKLDFLFQKQLRFNSENPSCKEFYTKAFLQIETQTLKKLNQHLGIEDQPLFAKSFFKVISESFLLRVTKKDFTFEWMKNYVGEVFYLINQMKSK